MPVPFFVYENDLRTGFRLLNKKGLHSDRTTERLAERDAKFLCN
jgi:hypothetical protein